MSTGLAPAGLELRQGLFHVLGIQSSPDASSHVLPDMQEDMADHLGRVLFGRS